MRGTRRVAVGLSVMAAFLWSSYYFIALAIDPSISLAELVVVPFLIGGATYAGIASHQGSLPALGRLFWDGRAWIRAGLYAGIQVTVVAVTLYAGPVDTSLLTLVGDVLLTPLVAATLYGRGRDRITTASFIVGLLLVAAGASLTIVSGGAAEPLRGVALIAGILIPLFIAFYFVATAEVAHSLPVDAVVGASCVQAGLLVAIATPVVGGVLGGWPAPPLLAWVGLIILGVTSFAIAPVAYFAAIERVGILLPALLMAGIPVFTLILQTGLLHKIPTALAVIGIAAAVAGALIAVGGWETPTASPDPVG
jgi:drug/metabolite transporter (DMT)-like permease